MPDRASATALGTFDGISWTLVAYVNSVRGRQRFSRRHLLRVQSDRTLCGIKPPFASSHFHQNSNGCDRCARAARQFDHVGARAA